MKKKFKELIIKIKKLFESLLRFLKKVFSNKRNILIAIICIIIILAIVLAIVVGRHRRHKFALNSIYELFPYEVKEIYSNLVSVSCYGDIHFDIELDGGEVALTELNKNNLIDYTFSYLDKNDLLNKKMDAAIIKKTERDLFSKRLDLVDEIKNYGYGDYTYDIKNGKITRAKRECTSDIQYISHLYGYSYDEKGLSMDVNVAYLKDGMLYDYSDKELGEYNGDRSKLDDLTKRTTFYRMYYVKRNGLYKLASVEWKSRGEKNTVN